MYETRNIEDEKILQDKNRIKETRIELLRLMALDDEWHRDETSELYKKIMACSEELRRLTSDKRKIRRMSQEEYMRLRALGYTLHEIADYYGVSVSYLNKWRQNKGIIV
ncbi:hypothetical protein WMK_02862 [Enterococcus faecalis ATCC 35038]|uniref:hypothetical protein n=1 Tax=Enterococcus faecalis TaxID=1351 RepID=UPI00032E6876|nr:hypothetical protein [Enterococcus faecalis]EGO7954135.1 hypothetical protein [Enterococcus faecalis]EHZ5136442.1 hypothetical protein [Enterococcus faecalis]EIR3903555.1 hypothetical protein [Enterococcus faecalis]EOJ52977.1 hypothetical protein WMK_02862 [Enterococcus faecalis ATCC 35038]PLA95319.1 hypothetical protein CYR78_13245 [Enterococcus faecalis]